MTNILACGYVGINLATALVVQEPTPTYAKIIDVSASVQTNVTHWNNEITRPYYSVSYAAFTDNHPMEVIKEATERTETMEIVETRTLKFEWEGVPFAVTKDKVLSKTVKRWVRKADWVEE